jgi:pimeloyl-ACP methyl ester carboxylesterase
MLQIPGNNAMRTIAKLAATFILAFSSWAHAQMTQKVIDIPTRPDVTQRMIVLTPPEPKAAIVLLPGGHGGLQVFPNGSMKWGEGNFLVRTRQLFAEQGVMVAVVDAPSDRKSPPYLREFRQTPEHAADLKAVIAWLRNASKAPVWLIGTSRGTQSAAYVATELSGPEGPDGVVLSSTILTDNKNPPVPAMPLGKIKVPVLVVHHEQDGCSLCLFSAVPTLMAELTGAQRSHLLSFTGGQTQGDPCHAMAHHGYNGIEPEVVRQMVAWMLAK